MFTSDTDYKKNIMGNLIATVVTALFGAIYEIFGFGVYSYSMIYAFAVPLCMGVVPYFIATIKKKYISSAFFHLWNSAIASISAGLIFKGILDIYGTTNRLVYVYFIIGGVMAVVAWIAQAVNLNIQKKACRDKIVSGNVCN